MVTDSTDSADSSFAASMMCAMNTTKNISDRWRLPKQIKAADACHLYVRGKYLSVLSVLSVVIVFAEFLALYFSPVLSIISTSAVRPVR
jgi:hypothetical protein